MIVHWGSRVPGEETRAACGSLHAGEDLLVTPSMSAPTCPRCRQLVQDTIDAIAEFAAASKTLPGRPAPPMPRLASGEITAR